MKTCRIRNEKFEEVTELLKKDTFTSRAVAYVMPASDSGVNRVLKVFWGMGKSQTRDYPIYECADGRWAYVVQCGRMRVYFEGRLMQSWIEMRFSRDIGKHVKANFLRAMLHGTAECRPFVGKIQDVDDAKWFGLIWREWKAQQRVEKCTYAQFVKKIVAVSDNGWKWKTITKEEWERTGKGWWTFTRRRAGRDPRQLRADRARLGERQGEGDRGVLQPPPQEDVSGIQG